MWLCGARTYWQRERERERERERGRCHCVLPSRAPIISADDDADDRDDDDFSDAWQTRRHWRTVCYTRQLNNANVEHNNTFLPRLLSSSYPLLRALAWLIKKLSTCQSSHNQTVARQWSASRCVSWNLVNSCPAQFYQELIRRWDSERELFNDDIAHT